MKKQIATLIFPILMMFNAMAQSPPATLSIKKVQDFPVTEQLHSTWESAAWIDLPLRSEGKVQYKTRAKVLYSDKGIYFLMHCEDKKLTATLNQDFADLFKEDVVEVFLWPDENQTIYFEYELSPLNFELPILVPNNGGKFLGWLPWHYYNERKVVHTTSTEGGPRQSGATVSAWTAQFFIPFDLLRPLNNVPPVKGTRWRANMYRLDYDEGQTRWAWQPIRTNFHDYESYGTFVFE